MNNASKYVGKILDRRYQIHKILGIGGMAVVFEATDLIMNRTVALKMLREDMSDDEEAVKRFINESKAVSMLSHPNIVKIFDVSVKGRMKYIVMERIEGITLKGYMQKKGALSTEEVLSYSEQVLKALEHAHSKGIVHRDIKPQNILLLKNGRVKVTDFGIAVLPTTEQTRDGKAIGTVYYISPEQASGKETDTRSDLYSLGVLMYEMATGTLPFNAETPVSVALMQVREQPTPPSERKAGISKGLEQIILGAMEKNPDRRFQSAAQMLKYLERIRLNPDYIFKTRDTSVQNPTAGAIAANEMKKKVAKKKTTKKRRESTSMFPIILGVAVAFALVLVIGAITVLDMVMKADNQNTPETIRVPDLMNETYSESAIIKLLDPSIFKVEVEYVHNENPAGTIIDQNPKPNATRKVLKNKQYCTVKLKVSRGTEQIAVPDYITMDWRQAQIEARKLGFEVELKDVTSEIFAIGTIVRTEPAPTELVEYGSTIILYKSAGPNYTKITVDDYVGKTPAQASTLIAGDLRIGNVTYDYSDTVSEGKIMSQSLAKGTQQLKGSVIDFVISLGPKETTPPETNPPQTSESIEGDPDEPDLDQQSSDTQN